MAASADDLAARCFMLEELLRRALKDHDRICGALRTGIGGPRLFKAIDEMVKVKSEATDLGLYP